MCVAYGSTGAFALSTWREIFSYQTTADRKKYDNIQCDYYACHDLLCWKCSPLHVLELHLLEVIQKQVWMSLDRNLL